MSNQKTKDIFEGRSFDQITSELVRGANEINLYNLETKPFEPEEDYGVVSFHLPKEAYNKKIKFLASTFEDWAHKQGFPGNVFVPLYEAVLNAHQHGNSEDSSKTIRIAHNIREGGVEMAVMDEGSTLDPDFVHYVMYQRTAQLTEDSIQSDFYGFSHRSKPSTNKGVGTTLIHTYSDEVHYYKSPENGLVTFFSQKSPDLEEKVSTFEI